MTLGTTLYYEKKMSYDEGKDAGIRIGEERGIQIGEEHMAEKLLNLGVDPAIIKKSNEG